MRRLFAVMSAVICVAISTGCAEHYLATVSLDNALTEYGRVNSYDLPLGSVLMWNKKTGDIQRFVPILRPGIPLQRVPDAGTQQQVAIKGISETDVSVTTPPLSNLPVLSSKATFGIQTAIGSGTQLELDQYYIESYDGRYALPNDASTFAWRQKNLGADLLDPDVVFVFVEGDTTAGTAKFYTGTPLDAQGNGKALDNSITIAGSKVVDISYTRNSSITKTGSGIPSIIKYQYYTLQKNPQGASGYSFNRITGKAIDVQFVAALGANGID